VNELVRFALTAYFPPVDDLPGLADLGVDAKIDALRRESTLLFWTGIVAASVFFQLSPLFTVHKPLPAAWLSEEDLDQHAYKLASHPIYLVRQITFLLKLVGGLFWGQSPEIRAFVALPPYENDPGTRRTESLVEPPKVEPRAPVAKLVTLGRREQERGRDKDRGKGLRV